jgi:hypothetical protein
VDDASSEGCKKMTEEDDYEYYQAMFRDSIVWAVAIVVSFALFSILA